MNGWLKGALAAGAGPLARSDPGSMLGWAWIRHRGLVGPGMLDASAYGAGGLGI